MEEYNTPTIGLTCSDYERSVPYSAMLEKFGASVKLITPSNFNGVPEIIDNIEKNGNIVLFLVPSNVLRKLMIRK